MSKTSARIFQSGDGIQHKIRFACFFVLSFGLFVPNLSCSDSLDKIAKKISKSAGQIKNKQIAVLPFPYHDGKESEGSTIISERLVTKIVSEGKLKVVERSLLEKVFGELKLQYTGMISQESAKKIGNILGVEAILTGTLIDLGNNEIEINARLINSETGLVLTASSENKIRDWQEISAVKKKTAVEPATTKESDKINSDDETKNKMSVFFHSREWKDPRFSDDEKPQAEPHEPMILSNTNPSAGNLKDDFATDSPSEILGHIPVDEIHLHEFRELQQAWELTRTGKKDYSDAINQFMELRKRFYDLHRPRLALLAQIYLSEIYLEKGNYDQAIREVHPIAKNNAYPKLKAYALFIAARSFEGLGKNNVASNLYRDIVQNHPFESRLIRASGYRLRRK